MKVVILCGGLGTRFREETRDRPKPMIEVGGKPILWHVMRTYAHYGFREFVLCLGYRGEVIKNYFVNYHVLSNNCTVRLGSDHAVVVHDDAQAQDWSVTLVDTGAATMTGGRIARIRPYVGHERFLATYGDGVADIDLPELLRFHEAHGASATMTGVRVAANFGFIDVDSTGRVTGFREKPILESLVNGGFFVFEPDVFEYLDGDACVLEREPLQRLAADRKVVVYPHCGFWQCMDHYGDYAKLNEAASTDRPPWAVWQR
ncbi:glucose-1-phosphate cytidylyltransferase [Myxococcota bacterium]